MHKIQILRLKYVSEAAVHSFPLCCGFANVISLSSDDTSIDILAGGKMLSCACVVSFVLCLSELSFKKQTIVISSYLYSTFSKILMTFYSEGCHISSRLNMYFFSVIRSAVLQVITVLECFLNSSVC